MKTCPFCAEEIQDAAIVCKHCGRDLAAAPVRASEPAKKGSRGAWVLIAIPVAFAIGIWFIWANSDVSLDLDNARSIVAEMEGRRQIVKRSCGPNQVTVDRGFWASIPTDQTRAKLGAVIVRVCFAEGSKDLSVTFADQTDRVVGIYSHGAMER